MTAFPPTTPRAPAAPSPATVEPLEPRRFLSAAAPLAGHGHGTTLPPAPAPRAAAAAAPVTTAAVRRDAQFLQRAEGAELLEIELGPVARANGSLAAVKALGARMVTDDTDLLGQVRRAAASLGVALTGTVDAKGRRAIARLSGLTGTQFDHAYTSVVVTELGAAVRDVTTEGRRTAAPAVRALTAGALPVVRADLALARSTRAAVLAAAFGAFPVSDAALDAVFGNAFGPGTVFSPTFPTGAGAGAGANPAFDTLLGAGPGIGAGNGTGAGPGGGTSTTGSFFGTTPIFG
jgi:predicted outer membrane protein